ncbi:hypothetical protein FC96_GL000121 [Secundilactobacillus kimchicus JCM 15530]|uniref:YhaN AAA domain-containing protein n=1 Tax=Secundilactobacillus kimchicus JCM 15530 TaxID=1302272 RepID=A0A0R1HRE1_9LACO|nr:AAA family ATPase [Secundilactobacillus kimchicus]KRK49200.1 hypothetical protein FC96_GL000121 [Secundilactobacillus kimchicus JCM 15530]
MKIKRLTIYGFGKFHDVSLDLDQHFQLIYGPNEAGKSTLVEFITSLLFGFLTAKHRYQMYKPKDGATYGGEMTFTHAGDMFWLKRVSGKGGGDVTFKNVTQDLDLTKADLTALLRPVNRDLFREIFCFDETDLGEVFSLDRFELTNRIQRIGAVGSDNWIKLNKKLHKDADDIFKPRGRVQPLAKALAEHDDLEKKIIAAKQDYPRYQELTAKSQQLEAALTKVNEEAATKLAAVATDTRLEQVYDGYQAYRDYQNSADKSAVVLPPADWQTYTTLTTTQQQLTDQLAQSKTDLAGLRAHNEPSSLQRFYLDHQQTIDDLTQRLDDLSQDLAAKQAIDRQLQTDQARLAELTDRYGQAEAFNRDDADQVKNLLTETQTVRLQLEENARQLAAIDSELSTADEPSNAQGVSLKWLAAGIVIVVIALFALDGALKTIGGLIGVIAAAYGIFRPMLTSQRSSGTNEDYLRERQADLTHQASELSASLATFNDQVATLQQTYQLGELPPTEWLASQPELRQKAQLATAVKLATEKSNALAQKLTQGAQQWDFAVDQLGLSTDLSDRINQVKQFVTARHDESQRLRLATDAIQKADQQVAGLTQQLADNGRKIKDFLAARNLPDETSFEKAYATGQKIQQQRNQVQAIADQLSADDLAALEQFSDKLAIVAARKAAQAAYDSAHTHQQALVQEKTAADYEMAQIKKSGDYQQLLQDQAVLETEIEAMADEWLANEMLIQWIDQTLVNASKGRQPQILASATTFFGILTDGRYTKLAFTDDTIEVTRSDSLEFDVGELSRGTAEQLYVALRFAFTQVMAAEIQMPVIIDDSFVNFDRDRIQNAFKLLHDLEDTTQILYFTADRTNTQLVADDHCLTLTREVQ